MRMDEAPSGQSVGELGPQLAHVDVNRAISGPQRPAPDRSVELFSRHDAIRIPHQFSQKPELAPRERHDAAVRANEMVAEPQLQWTGPQRACSVLQDGAHGRNAGDALPRI